MNDFVSSTFLSSYISVCRVFIIICCGFDSVLYAVNWRSDYEFFFWSDPDFFSEVCWDQYMVETNTPHFSDTASGCRSQFRYRKRRGSGRKVRGRKRVGIIFFFSKGHCGVKIKVQVGLMFRSKRYIWVYVEIKVGSSSTRFLPRLRQVSVTVNVRVRVGLRVGSR